MVHLVLVEMTLLKCYQTAAQRIVKDEPVVVATMLDCSVVVELFTQGPVQTASQRHLEGSKSTQAVPYRLK
jgi:hypothetical protein